jgi:hypothetical protein
MIGIIPSCTADAPIIQIRTDNIYLKAGQENTLKIILQNTGDYKVFDVEAFLTSTNPDLTVLTKANNVFTEIAADKSKSYEPTIYVDESVPLGAYSLTLTVNYRRSDSISIHTITVPIGLVVSEAFTPKIVYSPSLENIEVKSGILNEAEFNFVNAWSEVINKLEIVLSSSINSITVQDGIFTEFDNISTGELITVKPTIAVIEGTPLGTYSLTATASYVDSENNRYYQSFVLPINVASAAAVRTTIITIDSMKIVEESIQPGDIFTIELEIACSGADAFDLMSSLNFAPTSPISPISPSIVNLGDLEVGEMIESSYRLLASGSITAGQYPVTATISYINNKGISKTLTETLTVLVDGLIDFELLDIPSEQVAAGETKELEADLLLIGTESVDFVSVGVVEDQIIKRVSGSEEYIGAVDPDSPIPFDVNYLVDEEAKEGEHELKLSVKYRDHLNREHEERIGLNIEIGQSDNDEPQDQQLGFWVWIRRFLGLGP